MKSWKRRASDEWMKERYARSLTHSYAIIFHISPRWCGTSCLHVRGLGAGKACGGREVTEFADKHAAPTWGASQTGLLNWRLFGSTRIWGPHPCPNRGATTFDTIDGAPTHTHLPYTGWVQCFIKIEDLIWVSFGRAFKFQSFNWRVGSNPRRWAKNMDMKYQTRLKLVHETIRCMFRVRCEKLRINHLTPHLVVTMVYAWWFLWWVDYSEDFKRHLYFCFWGLRFEGFLWERYILKGQISFEGHWRLQPWTLGRCGHWTLRLRSLAPVWLWWQALDFFSTLIVVISMCCYYSELRNALTI